MDIASNMTVAGGVAGDLNLRYLVYTLNLASNKAMTIQTLQRVLTKLRFFTREILLPSGVFDKRNNSDTSVVVEHAKYRFQSNASSRSPV